MAKDAWSCGKHDLACLVPAENPGSRLSVKFMSGIIPVRGSDQLVTFVPGDVEGISMVGQTASEKGGT